MSTPPPLYVGRNEPAFPCRVMPTRHCPVVYAARCGDRPCARYESDDPAPWVPELQGPPKTMLIVDDAGTVFIPDGDR